MSENNDVKSLLVELQKQVTKGLLTRIKNDEATGAEFSAAINLLKNNHITVDDNTNNELDELSELINKRKKRFEVNNEDRENVLDFNKKKSGDING